MIKAVIFDCFGVLTADLWREFLDSLPPEADVVRARELNHQYDAGLIGLDEFLDQVEEATGHRPREVENLLDNETTKNTALLEYIRDLKQRGYKIGLISNIASNWIRDKFLTEDEQNLFDAMVLSFEAGTTKPDPEIYKIACQRLDVEPEQVIFTDDINDYCKAAESLGITGVHYTGFRQLKSDIEAVLNQS